MVLFRFIVRTIRRFIGGMAWLFILAALVALTLTIGLGLFLEALAIGWTLVVGFLYLASDNPLMLHIFWRTLLIASVGMGVVVAFFGMIKDVYWALRNGLARSDRFGRETHPRPVYRMSLR